MKTISIVAIAALFACQLTAGQKLQGHVFQPSRSVAQITSITLRNAPFSDAAEALAIVTQKEVFLSAKIDISTLPDFDMQGDRARVAEALIKVIESTKGSDIAVVEVGPSILAIIKRTAEL